MVGNGTTMLAGSDQSLPNAEIVLLFVLVVVDPGVQLSEPNVTFPIRRQLCAIPSNFILMIMMPKNILRALGLKSTNKMQIWLSVIPYFVLYFEESACFCGARHEKQIRTIMTNKNLQVSGRGFYLSSICIVRARKR